MAEMLNPTISKPETFQSSAAEQARIRKERREAKIRANGTDRLNQITGLGGGVDRDLQQRPAASNSAFDPAADPEEVDISQNFHQSIYSTRLRTPQSQTGGSLKDGQRHSTMLGLPHDQGGPGPSLSSPPGRDTLYNDFSGTDDMGSPGGEDSMLKLLQQMMGGLQSEGPNGMPSFPGIPPNGISRQEAAGMAVVNPTNYAWRLVHAVLAVTLGLFIAWTVEFTGTNIERQRSSLNNFSHSGWGRKITPFFYIFATAEVLLQSSRFFFEKGVIQPSGIFGTVMGFFPQPWKGYLTLLLRYSRIWSTVTGDALVCVFVLGVCSWIQAA